MNRLQSIGTNPVIRNFAKDSSQASVRRVASFLAPTVEVPTLTGKYKVYDAKHRYKRPVTKRAADGSVTRLGFTASDANYNLVPHALDFPIANVETLNDEGLLNQARYGTSLLADAAGLDHEAETIETALAAVGAGTDQNFAASGYDPIAYLDGIILSVIKLAKMAPAFACSWGPLRSCASRTTPKCSPATTAAEAEGAVRPSRCQTAPTSRRCSSANPKSRLP